MASVLDALDLVRSNRRLPTEAFFVDANVVIDFADPFGRSSVDHQFAQRNSELSEALNLLKPHCKSLSVATTAMEYYKFLQVGYFKARTGLKSFDGSRFKELRAQDPVFIAGWNGQLKKFSRLFGRNFPMIDQPLLNMSALRDFDGTKTDFGDHLLYRVVVAQEAKLRCVFTNDSDFLFYPDSVWLLTTNQKIIERARSEGKLKVGIERA